ncbi:hypothetical protein EJB05_44886, partial [Eragrostis curvula]
MFPERDIVGLPACSPASGSSGSASTSSTTGTRPSCSPDAFLKLIAVCMHVPEMVVVIVLIQGCYASLGSVRCRHEGCHGFLQNETGKRRLSVLALLEFITMSAQVLEK